MASDHPAVPLHGSGPDAAIARVPERRRRRGFGLRAPAGEAIRTLRLLLLGSILAPLLVLVGGSYVAYKTTVDHARTGRYPHVLWLGMGGAVEYSAPAFQEFCPRGRHFDADDRVVAVADQAGHHQ